MEGYAPWLDSRSNNSSLITECLKPFDAGSMKKYPVSHRVNRPENDDQECARETSIAFTPTLF
jgi:putative SOS response-associated peptidase YedK